MELSRAELWFCAPNTPAIGEAQLRTLHTGRTARRVWVRLVPSRLAPLQAGQKASELFLKEETEHAKSGVLRRDGTLFWSDAQRDDDKNWRKKIGKMLSSRTSRVWQSSRDHHFGVVIYNSGEGEIYKAQEWANHFDSVEFWWGESCSNEQFARWPQAEFDSHFERQFADFGSPLRRAYEWQNLSETERTERVTHCEWGSWDEMKSLAQCVLVLAYSPDFNDNDPFGNCGAWDVLDEDSDPFSELPPVLEEWAKLFRRVFQPRILSDDAASYQRQHFNRMWSELYACHLESEPTAHQKMEAMLPLRDWLAEHAPDDAARLFDFSRPT